MRSQVAGKNFEEGGVLGKNSRKKSYGRSYGSNIMKSFTEGDLKSDSPLIIAGFM